MSNPYAKFLAKASQRSIVKRPEKLGRGRLYPVVLVEKKLSMYKDKDGKEIFNMIVHFKDNDLTFSAYMPSVYNNPTDDDVVFFNTEIKKNKPGNVVYYGTVGQSKQFELLPFGEAVDQAKLSAIIAAEEEEKERDENSPSKKLRLDRNLSF